jgi:iron complex outermembrane receptor protein
MEADRTEAVGVLQSTNPNVRGVAGRVRTSRGRELGAGVALAALALTAAPALAQSAAQPSASGSGQATGEARGEPARSLEVVVVTAQRRSEELQNVPVAVTAFTASELERRNITEALELVQYVPNLIGHNNTGLATANTYFIRGIGDTESLASKDPPVGTYIDDIYFARQSANNFAFFDIDRIEVLRGPQGTLYGRNTTGGSINVFIKKPRDAFGGQVEVGVGAFGKRAIRASADLPVNERLLTKVSGYFTEDDGYVKNVVTRETLNAESNHGGRLAVRALITDDLQWDGFVLHMHAAGSNLINFACDPSLPGNIVNTATCGGRFASTGLRVANNGASQYPTLTIANGKGAKPLGNETDTTIFGSNLQYVFGDAATLNVITGWVTSDQSYNLDFFDGRAAPSFSFVLDPATGRPTSYAIAGNVSAGGPVVGRAGGFAIAAIAKTEQFTQEIKLNGALFDGRIDYVAGLFYFDETNDSDFADILTNAGTGVATLLADRRLVNTTEAWAAYAQVDFNLTDTVKLTAGVRHTDEKKTYSFFDNRPACAVSPLPANCIDDRNFAAVDIDANPATPPVFIPRDQQLSIWTPRFAVNWKPLDDVLVFASATRGFRSGGQSARATSVRFLLPFGPETVWSYEAGAKTQWFDDRLRVNATLFKADTSDLQGGSAFVTTNVTTGAQTLTFVTRNFGDFKNQGLELELMALPVPGLTLSASAGYQKAKYILDAGRVDAYGTLSATAQIAECRAALAGAPSPRGDTRLATARAQSSCGNGVVTPTGELAKPPRTPEWTVTLGASYEIPAPALGGSITPSLNLLYTSDQEVGTSNTSFHLNAAGVLNVNGDGPFITGSFSEAHWVMNASVGYETDSGDWSASIECSNCLNVKYPQSTLSNFSYLNQPATWMAKLRRTW